MQKNESRAFSSDIVVGTDSTLTVQENITLSAEGKSIRHGIYRDLSSVNIDRLGNRLHVARSVTQSGLSAI